MKIIDMKIRNPYSLSELSVEVIAKAAFDRLIDCNDRKKVNALIRDFVVNTHLPKFVVLQVINLLLVYMDRGYNRQFWPRPPCEDASRYQEMNTKLLEGDMNDLGRRQRALWIMKAHVHYLMSRWNDELLHPVDLLKETLVAPRAMSMRGKQTVIMHMTESFIYWRDAISCNDLSICDRCIAEAKQPWPCPPHILELRAEHGNWMGTRIALAAISSSIRGMTNFEGDDDMAKCQKCGRGWVLKGNKCMANTEKNVGDFVAYDRPLLKLDVVLMGQIQDWVVDVLLFVLRNSSSKGVDIEISGIRCENFELEKFKEVVDSLAMPQNVRSLEYRTTSPTEIFSASETLAKLSGLESFICTDIQITFEARSRFTVKQCQELGRILQRWNSLTKLRMEGISLFSDYNQHAIEECSIFPKTLQILEFSHNSLNKNSLCWLTKLTSTNQYNKDDSASFHTLRFEYEKILSSSDKTWKNFLTILKNTRKSILTLAIDHCNMNEAQALALEHIYCDKNLGDDIRSSVLQHLTIRDSGLSVKATCNILTELCIASKYRNLSKFSYFGCLPLARSDQFWVGKFEEMKKNSEWCPLQDAMRKICNKHGCSNISLDLFWDPSEEDLY